MGKDAVTIPDDVRPLLERMAGQLSEQIFPEGMPWGTKFDHLETLAGALGDENARQMIQANVHHSVRGGGLLSELWLARPCRTQGAT